MADTWTLNGAPLSSLRISGVNLTYVSLAPDTLSWEDPSAAFDAAPRWPFDSEIVLLRDGVCVFRGRITETPRFAGGRAESIRYLACGPWQQLDEIAFTQGYKVNTTPEAAAPTFQIVLAGHVIANADDEGERIGMADAIKGILAHATSGDANLLAAGTINLGAADIVPLDETTDVSCAGAILRLLVWAPDAVSWFDYTATPPVLNIARRGNLPAKTLAVGGKVPLNEIELNPLDKLVVPGVVLLYRTINQFNATRWVDIVADKAPPNANTYARRALVRTIDLQGSVGMYSSPGSIGGARQKINRRFIPESINNTVSGAVTQSSAVFGDILNLFSWCGKKHDPELTEVSHIGRVSREAQAKDSGDATNGGAWANFDPDCKYLLLDGGLPDKIPGYENVKMQRQRVTALFRYRQRSRIISSSGSISGYTAWSDWVNAPSSVTYTAISYVPAEFRLPTESTGGGLDDYEAAEEVPIGLANLLYSALSQLHYEGTLTLTAAEPTSNILPGVVLNLTGSRAEWVTMRALVQQSSLDIDNGTTRLTLGPPSHLSPSELVEIVRSNRTRRLVQSLGAMKTGIV